MEDKILTSYDKFCVGSRVFTAVAETGGILCPVISEVVIDIIYGRISDIRECEDGVFCWIEGFRDLSDGKQTIRMTVDNVFFEYEEALIAVIEYMKQRLKSGKLTSFVMQEYRKSIKNLSIDPPLGGILKYYEYLKDKYRRKEISVSRSEALNKHIVSKSNNRVSNKNEYIVVYEYNHDAPVGSRGLRVILVHKSEEDFKKNPLGMAKVIADGISMSKAEELSNTITGIKEVSNL